MAVNAVSQPRAAWLRDKAPIMAERIADMDRVATERYHACFDNQAYKAATEGKTTAYANALTGEAMALCGSPYYSSSNRAWGEAARSYLYLFCIPPAPEEPRESRVVPTFNHREEHVGWRVSYPGLADQEHETFRAAMEAAGEADPEAVIVLRRARTSKIACPYCGSYDTAPLGGSPETGLTDCRRCRTAFDPESPEIWRARLRLDAIYCSYMSGVETEEEARAWLPTPVPPGLHDSIMDAWQREDKVRFVEEGDSVYMEALSPLGGWAMWGWVAGPKAWAEWAAGEADLVEASPDLASHDNEKREAAVAELMSQGGRVEGMHRASGYAEPMAGIEAPKAWADARREAAENDVPEQEARLALGAYPEGLPQHELYSYVRVRYQGRYANDPLTGLVGWARPDMGARISGPVERFMWAFYPDWRYCPEWIHNIGPGSPGTITDEAYLVLVEPPEEAKDRLETSARLNDKALDRAAWPEPLATIVMEEHTRIAHMINWALGYDYMPLASFGWTGP